MNEALRDPEVILIDTTWVDQVKGSKANPDTYRSVHLTPVASKVVERILGSVLTPYLETGKTGSEA